MVEENDIFKESNSFEKMKELMKNAMNKTFSPNEEKYNQ